MTHSKKTQAWKGSLSISTSFSVSMLPHSFSWHTHTRSLFLPHTHIHTGYTQVHTSSMHTPIQPLSPATHTKAYQYGRFSNHWGVQTSLTSQHNKTISPSLMKWLTQLTDEWGEGEDAQNNGETASRAEGGRQPLEESRTVLIMSLQDLWISAAFLVVPTV